MILQLGAVLVQLGAVLVQLGAVSVQLGAVLVQLGAVLVQLGAGKTVCVSTMHLSNFQLQHPNWMEEISCTHGAEIVPVREAGLIGQARVTSDLLPGHPVSLDL